MSFFAQPSDTHRLGDFLKEELSNEWDRFRAAVAFVKRSGTKHISTELLSFSKTKPVEIIAGIDHFGSSAEGLNDLLQAVQPNGKVLILHNELPFTFHPKVFLFTNSVRAVAIVGSGNLTEGGLHTNYEAGLRLELELSNQYHAAIHNDINATLDRWADPSTGITLELNQALLTTLTTIGKVPPEALSKKSLGGEGGDAQNASGSEDAGSATKERSPFAFVAVPKAPVVSRITSTSTPTAPSNPTQPARVVVAKASGSSVLKGFVMTLQKTDVGVGQMSKGTSRRSPEIFIPLGARDMNPTFWGWPREFLADAGWAGRVDKNGFGKMDRNGVLVRLGVKNVAINMFYNPNKRDLRLRSEELRSAGSIGDILRIEKVISSPYEYYVEIVPTHTTQYPVYLARCDQSVRPPSKKRYGYY